MPRKRFKATDKKPKKGSERKFKLNLYDTERADISLFNSIDAEQIKLTGSDVYYYKYYRDSSYDEVFAEDQDKILSRDPIKVTAHFNPSVVEEHLTDFGLELINDQTFIFNKTEIENILGRKPIPGDQIVTDFQNIRYEIHEVQEDSYRIYGVYHYNCYAKVLRDNQNTSQQEPYQEGDLTDDI
jgi:hypothetical protein